MFSPSVPMAMDNEDRSHPNRLLIQKHLSEFVYRKLTSDPQHSNQIIYQKFPARKSTECLKSTANWKEFHP